MNLKGIDYSLTPVNLVEGAQRSPDYIAINPAKGVPALVTDDGTVLTQSMAIIDWLEETRPEPALLPADPVARARVRAAALGFATDIHPVNNLRVIARLKSMGHDQAETVDWMNHWMAEGFTAVSRLIEEETAYCFGEMPGLADLCLVPQLYNARRWGLDLTPFERLTEIEARCLQLPAFANARPEAQPDAT